MDLASSVSFCPSVLPFSNPEDREHLYLSQYSEDDCSYWSSIKGQNFKNPKSHLTEIEER
jgi:hypothetical protein